MFVRPIAVLLYLLLLSGAVPAAAQQGVLNGPGPRTDILTGEPVRPRSAQPRREPEIFNAPHAPRQEPGRGNPPMEIYIAPQIGVGNGTGYPGNNGFAGQPPRRPIQQGQPYPGRLRQGNPY